MDSSILSRRRIAVAVARPLSHSPHSPQEQPMAMVLPSSHSHQSAAPAPRFTTKHLAIIVLAQACLTVIFISIVPQFTSHQVTSSNGCLVSHGSYRGSIYEKPAETIGNACLVESPWMRLAQHSVRLPDDGKVIDDWLWIDYHDRINVVVEAPSQPESFMILSQTKYALDETSLAIVGGIIEPSEVASMAAQREVNEELGVICKNWKALGKFRTDVNRGMGWVSGTSVYKLMCVHVCCPNFL